MQSLTSFSTPVVSYFKALLVVSVLTVASILSAQTVVSVPDPNLEQAIRDNLGIPTGDIMDSDMAILTELTAFNSGIADLTGLEHAVNLSLLSVGDNSISDLSPLAGLTNLGWLSVYRNQISDLEPLRNLTNLGGFSASQNQISNLEPISNLPNLEKLYVQSNQVSDLSVLTGLSSSLKELRIDSNTIDAADLDVLADLTGLTVLSLGNNGLTELPSSVSNLTQLTQLIVGRNQLTSLPDLSAMTNLERLQVHSNQLSSLPDLNALTGLNWLLIQNNQLTSVPDLSALTSLEWLSVQNNELTSLPGVENLTSLTRLQAGRNQLVSIPDLSGLTQLQWLHVDNNQLTSIPDLSPLTNLQRLYVQNNDLTSLPGLSSLTSLQWLLSQNNQLTTLPSLTGFTLLQRINVRNNQLIDLPTLSGLSSLYELDATNNQLTALPDLTGADALTSVRISGNGIETISPLTGKNLTTLEIVDCPVADLTPISTFSNLSILSIGGQPTPFTQWNLLDGLSNLSNLTIAFASLTNDDVANHVANYTNLQQLFLYGNAINDFSPLSTLENLTQLNVNYNGLQDLSSLSGLQSLKIVQANSNLLTDISDLTSLPNLERVFLNRNPLDLSEGQPQWAYVDELIADGVIVSYDFYATVPDENLLAAIKDALELDTFVVSTNDLAALTTLGASGYGVTDLTGLEHATNLTGLYLSSNSVSDLQPISGLVNLQQLLLKGNSVTDLSTLSQMTSMTLLDVSYNGLENLSGLESLQSLQLLFADSNLLTDISAISELPELQNVIINRNPLDLYPGDPQRNIVDGLIADGVLVIYDFYATVPDENLLAAIKDAKGINAYVVSTDDIASLTTLDASGYGITGLTGLEHATNLETLNLSNNLLTDVFLLQTLPSLTSVDLRSNPLELETGDPQLAVVDALVTSGVVVDFNYYVNIPDPALLAAIKSRLNLHTFVVTRENMLGLRFFSINNLGVADLTGLEYATNLRTLNIISNPIGDFTPLSGLSSLISLTFRNDSINELSQISGLTGLTRLTVFNCSIEDISGISDLTNLTSLSLFGNAISDISAVSGMTNLTSLNVSLNPVSDLTPVAGLTNLTRLFFQRTDVDSLIPVSGLTNLEWLVGDNSPFADTSPLTGLDKLTRFFATGTLVSDLSPLVGKDLTGLRIVDCPVTDLSPIAGFANLEWLDLGGQPQPFTDWSLLDGLTLLTRLSVAKASLTDATPLAAYTNLTELFLYGNAITDFSPLSTLENLTQLNVNYNGLQDLSSLSGLQSLKIVQANSNLLTDISDLTSLPNLERVFLNRNPLELNEGFLQRTIIDDLIADGVIVSYDFYATVPDENLLAAIKDARDLNNTFVVSTDDIAALTELDASGYGITDLTGLELAVNLETLNLSNNLLNDVSLLTSLPSLLSVDLRSNPLELEVGGPQLAVVNALIADGVAVDYNFYVDIPDPALLAAIKTELSVDSFVMTRTDMAQLRSLRAVSQGIVDLTGLEYATDLTALFLNSNSISDVSALEGLTNLTRVFLPRNLISDITPLGGLTNLTTLSIFGNSISDVSALAGLSNLSVLILFDNSISDISSLSGLTNLTLLSLGNNSISDISAVWGMTNLKTLNVSQNPVSDLTPVSGLTNLTRLTFQRTEVDSLSPVAALTNLEQLLGDNSPFADTSPLANLDNLTQFHASGTLVSDLSPLIGKDIKQLRIVDSPITDLSPIAGFVNLNWLDLGGQPQPFTQWSLLDGLPLLTRLTVANASLTDVSPLANYTNLEQLYLYGNTITDFSPLGALENLTTLNVNYNGLENLTSLSDLQSLQFVQANANLLTEISTLQDLPNLQRVFLNRNPLELNEGFPQRVIVNELIADGVDVFYDFYAYVPDMNLLAAIKNARGLNNTFVVSTDDIAALTEIDASGYGIANLTGLEHGSGLERLYLSDNFITDVSPLLSLTALQELDLGGNSISDASPLGVMTWLPDLVIRENPVANWDWLADMTGLFTLDASETGIIDADLTTITSAPNLQALNVNLNGLTDLSGLFDGVSGLPLSDLMFLFASDNYLTDLSPLAALTSLEELHLAGNLVTDISPLVTLTGAGGFSGPANGLVITFNKIDFVGEPAQQINLDTLLLAPNLDVVYDPQNFDLVGYTPPGKDVPVAPEVVDSNGDPVADAPLVDMSFDEIDGVGETTVEASTTGPEIPTGFQFGDTDPIYLNIETTADFDGLVEICIDYSEIVLGGTTDPDELRLYHYRDSEGIWEDITTSNDTIARILCGETDSLSPFALLSPKPDLELGDLIEELIQLEMNEKLKGSLLAKLTGADAALNDGSQENNISAVNRIRAFINQVEAQYGKKISDSDADALLTLAYAFLEELL